MNKVIIDCDPGIDEICRQPCFFRWPGDPDHFCHSGLALVERKPDEAANQCTGDRSELYWQ